MLDTGPCLRLSVKMRLCSCVLLAAVCSLAWAEPVSLDKDSFAENIATGKPLFVKFFAPW